MNLLTTIGRGRVKNIIRDMVKMKIYLLTTDIYIKRNTHFENPKMQTDYSLVRLVMPNTEELISQPLEGL